MSGPQVLIVAGGLSHERDVSLRSGRRVAQELRSVGCQVTEADLDSTLVATILERAPDIVWPLLHGSSGEDGSLRDVLEVLNVPYLGSDPRASRMAWNKAVAKSVARRGGITTPDYMTLPQTLFRELGPDVVLQVISDGFGLPAIVKPSRGGSALGVTLVEAADQLPRAMVDCFAYSDIALIERAVEGTELAVSVVDTGEGPHALPAVEIVTEGPYDYDARYNPGRTEFFTPARLAAEDAERAAQMATSVHEALGLTRISRTDMILDNDGKLWFLEVDIAPGMTETSLLPQAVEASGTTRPNLYRALVEASIAAEGPAIA